VTGVDLRTALDVAVRSGGPAAATARPRGKAIAVLKAGGGAGATTIAVQTACVLSARRKARRSEVCLFDLDVQFGSAALYLDLDDRVGLADLLDAGERIDVELVRSVMGHHGTGLNVLAAPRDLLPLDAVPSDLIVESLNLARAAYDTIVIDLPGAWTPWSRATLGATDLILLVVQLTVPGIRRAKRQLDVLTAAGLTEVPVRLVLNRYRPGWGVAAQRREAERALGRPFDYEIPNDFASVSAAINRGAPLAAVARWSRVARAMRRLADGSSDTLAREPQVEATASLVAGRDFARLRQA
jgi:pilus assembly protein CpaE